MSDLLDLSKLTEDRFIIVTSIQLYALQMGTGQMPVFEDCVKQIKEQLQFAKEN